MSTELELIPAGEGPDVNTLARLDTPAIFKGFEEQFAPLETTANTLVVTAQNYLVQAPIARALRLQAKNARVAVEHRRVELVADLNKRTGSINSAAREIRLKFEALEDKLREQEEFGERLEADRKEALRVERGEKLRALDVDPSFITLGEMPDETWAQLLENSTIAHKAKQEAAAKAQREKIEAENARLKREAEEKAEAAHQLAENIRLKKEAEEREAKAAADREEAARKQREIEEAAAKERAEAAAKLKSEQEAAQKELQRLQKLADDAEAARLADAQKAERERKEAEEEAQRKADDAKAKADAERAESDRKIRAKARKEKEASEKKSREDREAAEAVARTEREAREKLEQENRDREAAEAKRIADETAAALAAAKAPDKVKLYDLADRLLALSVPDMATEAGNLAAEVIEKEVARLAKWIKSKAEAM